MKSKKPVVWIDSDYLHDVFDPKRFKRTVQRTCNALKKLQKNPKTKFDAIAFRGISGSALAFVCSHELDVPMICVRKGRNHHSTLNVEGSYSSKRYVIIDDCIDSGGTIKAIVRSINCAYKKHGYYSDIKPELVAIVLYSEARTIMAPSSELNV